MILPDVNVLLYAYRDKSPRHGEYREWLGRIVDGDEAFGLPDVVLSGFLRIVTHPGIFTPPSTLEDAIVFSEAIRRSPVCTIVRPGAHHWGIFLDLCRRASARGNLVTDAYLAALAIESGSEWITTDGDFARFPGLRWRRPF